MYITYGMIFTNSMYVISTQEWFNPVADDVLLHAQDSVLLALVFWFVLMFSRKELFKIAYKLPLDLSTASGRHIRVCS